MANGGVDKIVILEREIKELKSRLLHLEALNGDLTNTVERLQSYHNRNKMLVNGLKLSHGLKESSQAVSGYC